MDGSGAPPPGGRDEPPKAGRGRRGRRILIAVGAVVVVVLVVALVFSFVAWKRVDRVKLSLPGSPPGGTTYLLIGSDSRAFVKSESDRFRFGAPTATDGERADIILLVRTLPGGGMRVLGIPRDLMTQLPEGAPIRITQTLLRGPQTVVDTLCNSLGVGVDHVVIVHFDGLRRVVDAAGGITIKFAKPERDLISGFDVEHPGPTRLDGQQALAYVRSRNMEWLSPYAWIPFPPTAAGRSDRAREVLTLLGARLHLSATSPIGSVKKLWALTGAVTVDSHTSPFVMRDLARRLGRLGTAQHVDLPVTFRSGAIPLAFPTAAAAGVLDQFQGGSATGCSQRLVPSPDIPIPHKPIPGDLPRADGNSPGGTP